MDNKKDNFIGSPFLWFTGVVEDINDPMEMGRYRVRCFGYHTDSLDDLPTEDLPWAHVLTPITSASTSGIGYSATGLLQGSWVVGFFRDGINAQDPLIIGSIPSQGTPGDPRRGFNDPDDLYPLEEFWERPDTPEEATGMNASSGSFVSKSDTRLEKVETAEPPRVPTVSPNKADSYYTPPTWDTPKPEDYERPAYPKNHVYHSESGHVIEIDDTATSTRLGRFHKSGTYEEIIDNGTRIVTVVSDEYKVVLGNQHISITKTPNSTGNLYLTVEGDMRTLVKGNYHLEVEGDKTEYIKGSRISKIGGNELTEIDGQLSSNVAKDYSQNIGGNETRNVALDQDININNNFTRIVLGDTVDTTFGQRNTVVGQTFTSSSNDIMTMRSNEQVILGKDVKMDNNLNVSNAITTGGNITSGGSITDSDGDGGA